MPSEKVEPYTKAWIQGVGGVQIDILKPDASVLTPQRIAYSLAGINRYTGHARPRYNVAEHSIHVSNLAAKLARDSEAGPEHELLCARWGLMHDAVESVLGDVARPLKNAMKALMPKGVEEPYRKLEALWHETVAGRFGLPVEMPVEVDQADYIILGTEARDVMAPIHPDWGKTCPGGKLPDRIPGFRVHGWGAAQAEDSFLARFRFLFPEFKP